MARIDHLNGKKISLNYKQFFLVLLVGLLSVIISGCLGVHQDINEKQTTTPTASVPEVLPIASVTIPSGQGKIPESPFIAQSEDTIRKFTNNPDQILVFKGIINESYADMYEFKSGNSSFWVNNLSGRVQSALWYESGTKNQKEIIDLDQGLKIAEPYAKERYPELWNVTEKRGIKQKQKTDLRGDEKIFVYTWQEVFYNPDNKTDPHSEIPGLNSVIIEISPYTGHVTQYHELYEQSETLPNVVATITEDQAERFAILYFESTGISDVQQSELVPGGLQVTFDKDGHQYLTWNFSLTREDKNGFDKGGVVGIDAHDGQIVWHASIG